MLYYQMEPFGTDVEMYGHAMTSSTILNVHRDHKKRPNPITPSEMMPKWDTTDIADEQLQKVKQLNALFGGTEVKRGDDS